MHKFILFIKEFKIYKKREIIDAITSFSKKQFLIFVGIFFVAIVSLIIILSKVNSYFMISVPTSGGTISEGIIGFPTLVNPVIALSDADKDLTSLVYSGLMRKNSNGEFIPDLADSFTVSPDGTIYTFIIKDNARFHNGVKVSADDIIFTIEKIKDPIVKSPRRLGWDGIEINKINEKTVEFKLAKPYISFLDNTTIGILPSKAWKNVNTNEFNLSPLNTKAIGSGPYKVKSVIKNSDGIPEKYELKRFNGFTLGKPLIKYINIISYANEKDLLKALSSNTIDQAGGISPENVSNIKKNRHKIHTATLPRIFGIFYNSNKNKIFADKNVINAFNIALDREEIVNQVLNSYGSVISNPIPQRINQGELKDEYKITNMDEANILLEKSGWKMGEDGVRIKDNTITTTKKVKGKTISTTTKSSTPSTRLAFSLVTGDTPELRKTTELLKEQLIKIGVEVDIKRVYETGQLNQLIRARDYEALFFGQVINHESDLYSFWHSSQKADPGLNIAMYSNGKVDSILESIQKTLNFEDRLSKYENLFREFDNDKPALLIYSPEYIYITFPNLTNINLNYITVPSDRFNLVYEWSTNIDRVWKIFTK